jgi:tetratricopeptide (TPR) repeat protein
MFTRSVRGWLFLAVSAACGALLYGPHLHAPLIFDDIAFFSGNYASTCGIGLNLTEPRWWPCWTFAVQRILGGEDSLALFRAGNLILHVLAASALFLFLRQLIDTLPGRDRPAPPYSSDAVAAICALAFLLHPAAVYGAGYLIERSILMATLFSLLMWLAHLRGLETGKPVWFALAVLCCYLALYSKENSVMAPAVTVLLTLMQRRPDLPWRAPGAAFAAYAALMASVTLKSKGIIATAYELQFHDIVAQVAQDAGVQLPGNLYLASVLTQCANFFKYLFLWAVPLTSEMSIDMQEGVLDTAHAWTGWLAALAYLAWCATGFLLIRRKGRSALLGFAMLAPALLYLTEFSTLRLQEPFVLYRSYLWAPPLFAALALVLHRRRLSVLLAAGAVILPLFAVLAQGRLETFRSEFAVWDDAIRLAEQDNVKSPMRARQYFNRGSYYLNARQPQAALEDFERALGFSSRYVLALNGKGIALMRLGRYSEARSSLDLSVAIKPDYPQTLLARADVCNKSGDDACAVSDLKKACALGAVVGCYVLDRKTHPENKTFTLHFP